MTAVAADRIPAWRSGAQALKRDATIDTMRGLAIVMVIAIHALPKIQGAVAVTAIDALLRPCVPVFLFASGYLSARAPRVPLARRLKRLLGPYTIAFVAAYAVMAWQNPAMDHRPLIVAARYGLAYVFVYYYVFVYAGCTALLWLAFAAAGAGRGRLLLLLALAIVAGLTVGAYLDPVLQRLGVPGNVIEEARMRDLPFWFAFMALGVILGRTQAQPVLHELRYALAGATAAAFAAYAAIRATGLGDAADYDSLAFFLYAALFCLTVLGFAFTWPALGALGAASYFIYLWHIFPIMLLRAAPGLQHNAGGSLVKFAVALATSALLVAAIRRAGAPRLAQWLGA